jgi:hypothetical protein
VGAGLGEWVEQHAVDGEVAAGDVFAWVEGVADGVGAATVGVGTVVAEGGDLGEDAVAGVDEYDPEVSADGEGAGEQGEDHVGRGAGGDVKIFGRATEQAVAHAAACVEGLVAFGAEGGDDCPGCLLAHGVASVDFCLHL